MEPGRSPASHDLAAAATLASSDGSPPPHAPPQALADTDAAPHAQDASGATGPSASGDEAPRVGSRIGRYLILAKLGEGGMGEVYAGFDQELDRRVALKVVRPRRADDNLGRARMQREAQALARLSHPNVVQVHDVGELRGQVFVAMEYVPGESLGTWQQRHDPATPAGRRALLDMYMQAGRGLAAAHDAGIVHRDFKPGNVLVAADGRARVLDFGLAAERRAAPGEATVEATADDGPGGALDADLTRTGSVLGTPAYMAPEQFLAQPTDLRTDVFAFSVALHEALHGEAPFAGDSFAARREAVVAGRLREPPAATGVPAWLRAVVARGLARDPAARWPSMAAMLDALADDPIARRRKRRRLLVLVVAAVAAASVLLIAGLWGWERWQRGAAEARAAERLAAAEARVAAALAAGAPDAAERAFHAFVDHPDNRGSAALGRAWLHRAEQARDRDAPAVAVDAFASAYMLGTAAEDQDAALLGLARIFRDEMKWRALSLALATLAGRRGGVDAPSGPPGRDAPTAPAGRDAASELAGLRLDAQIARRDLAGAAALLRGPLAASPRAALLPVLAALQQATATAHQHRGSAVIADLDGDGRVEIVLETDARHRQLAPLLRAAPDLPALGTLDLGRERFLALSPGPREPALLVTGAGRTLPGLASHDVVIRRWRDGALDEVLRWPEHAVLSTLSADVDGDGDRELLIGTGPYSRRVTELVPAADGAWSTRAPAPDIDRRRSDVVDLLAEDLDDDGTVEVVAALGPWNAYELQVLRHDPASDLLRMFTRHRLGTITGAAVVRRGGALEIAVSETDEYRNAAAFPRDRPLGAPVGVHLFRLVADALVQTAFVPAPRLAAGARVALGRPLAGDLDGDGRDELIVGCSLADDPSAGERDTTMILVPAADGSLLPLLLGEMRPIAALDLDGDGDDELIVSDGAAAWHDQVWVLGSGAAAPTTIAPDLPRPVDALPSDPVLASTWQHAEELAQMGLARQAAERLATMADLVAEPGLRARALLRAGALQEALGADVQAAELYVRAAHESADPRAAHGSADPRAAPGSADARAAHESANAHAAHCLLRVGRVDAAAAHLAAAGASGEPGSAVAVAIAALRGEPGVDLDFARPLAPIWRIDQPLALRRDGAGESLHVDALGVGELVSAPVRWPGQSLSLAIDLELTRAEWHSSLEIGLVRPGTRFDDGSSPLGVDITTTGGGNERTHELACMSYGRRSVARIPFLVGDRGQHLGRVELRATLLPGLGEWTCEVVRASGERLLYTRNQFPVETHEAGPLRLAIASAQVPAAWLAAEIHRIQLAGASLEAVDAGPPDDAARVDARRAWIEDDPLAALAASARVAAPEPADRLIAVMALARLSRWAEAERALAPLLADPDAAASLSDTLTALLRTDPAVFGALVRGAAGPGEFRRRLATTWLYAVLVEQDPRAFAVAWSGLAERDLVRDPHTVLKIHAVAAAGLGHLAAAEASYRAALVAVDDPARIGDLGPAGMQENEAGALHLELAALALAAGDEAAARGELRSFIARSGPDLLFLDRLRARDDLRPVWDVIAE